jgi:hypothetical protein
MLQTVEVEIDAQGHVHPVGLGARLPQGWILLTPPANVEARLSEVALAVNWLRPEEDVTWATLKPGRPTSKCNVL